MSGNNDLKIIHPCSRQYNIPFMSYPCRSGESSDRLSQGAGDQVETTTHVATNSTQIDQASGDIARSTNDVAQAASKCVQIGRDGQERTGEDLLLLPTKQGTRRRDSRVYYQNNRHDGHDQDGYAKNR
jgi:hypothetical protein